MGIQIDFSQVPSNKPDVDKPTRYDLWETRQGVLWRLEDMHQSHIYNCIGMLERDLETLRNWTSVSVGILGQFRSPETGEIHLEVEIERRENWIENFEAELRRRNLPLRKELKP